MNKHILVDRLALTTASLLTGKRKYFSKTLEAHSFEEHLQHIELRVPELIQEGVYEISAKTYSGDVNPAVNLVQWLGFDYPTIIYHHDKNEQPFDLSEEAKNTFYQIFIRWPRRIPANLIVVRAPFHQGRLRQFNEKMTYLENFITMVAVPARITEWIIRQYRRRSQKPIIVAGISLGGWVTNLHRAHYNSAQAYIPVLAGAKLAEVFITSRYSRLTGELALHDPEALRQKLNFQEVFCKRTTFNLYPVLARFDQFVMYHTQKTVYNGFPLKTTEAGHITASLNTARCREHILEVLQMLY